jgi:hypothetical protein
VRTPTSGCVSPGEIQDVIAVLPDKLKTLIVA